MPSVFLPKSRSYVWLLIKYLGFLAVGFGIYYTAYYFLSGSSMAKLESRNDQLVRSIRKMEIEFDAARKSDAIGGKTPAETLNLFISALEKGDYNTASQYIALEKRAVWLRDVGTEGPGKVYIQALKKTALRMNAAAPPKEGVSSYVISSPMEISFIKYESGVWKIGRLP